MSDLFGDFVPDEYVRRVFDVMRRTPEHTYQVLTKRAGRMRDWCRRAPWLAATTNIWLGVSVEDEEYGLPRLAALRRTPAAVRFLSVEPLLAALPSLDVSGIDWVIVGGESGPVASTTNVGTRRALGLISYDPTPVNRDGHTPELMIGNVATGTWMRNSAVDDPRLLARTMRSFLESVGNGEAKTSYSQARELSLSKGQVLFRTRCSACHTIGRGDWIGPDLAGVTAVRDRAWLARFIQFPDRVLAEGDPIATALHERYQQVNMPNLRLGPEDVAALIAHLEERSTALGMRTPGSAGP